MKKHVEIVMKRVGIMALSTMIGVPVMATNVTDVETQVESSVTEAYEEATEATEDMNNLLCIPETFTEAVEESFEALSIEKEQTEESAEVQEREGDRKDEAELDLKAEVAAVVNMGERMKERIVQSKEWQSIVDWMETVGHVLPDDTRVMYEEAETECETEFGMEAFTGDDLAKNIGMSDAQYAECVSFVKEETEKLLSMSREEKIVMMVNATTSLLRNLMVSE